MPDTPDVLSSEAEVSRVSDLLHEQGDRLLEEAEHMTQCADETRGTATRQDAQADNLYRRAGQLHSQAKRLRADE